jgi:serine phosphatase RsbU (regulator of sigma subunit)
VVLALQNASLSQELSSTEQQLEQILDTLDAAITVRDRHGRMVYSNQAAADLLKLPDPDAVKAEPPGALMDRFDVYTEEGDPVDLADLPGTRLLAGETMPPAITVRNVVKATGEERWLLNKATGVLDADGRILMAVNLIDDVTETKRNEVAQSLLAKGARAIAEAPDLPKTLQAIARAAVPGLADWASVDLLTPSGSIETVAIAHRDPDKVRLGWNLRTRWPVQADAPDGLPAVIRTGVPQLVREISEEMLVAGALDGQHLEVLRAVGLNSVMIAPIRVGNRRLGALSFVSSTSRRFDERDLQLAMDLGAQAGIIINHAQLHAEQAHIAHTLQAGLIPEALPRFEGWSLSAAYRAAGVANEVGGDFYDVIEFDGGWAAIIGDVAGKGAQAAAVTAIARHTLAAITIATGDAAYAVEILNRRLRERGEGASRLCTIAVAVVSEVGRMTVISAGHPLPLLRHEGGVTPVGDPGPLLGFVDDLNIRAVEIPFEAGDQLVLYTDGVLDAVGEDGRFGEERLRSAMRSNPDATGGESAVQLLETIERFLVGEQNDDIAILSLARTRAPVGAEVGAGAL